MLKVQSDIQIGMEAHRHPNSKHTKKRQSYTFVCKIVFFFVGVTGLEPMASPTRTARSTKLSYTPNYSIEQQNRGKHNGCIVY